MKKNLFLIVAVLVAAIALVSCMDEPQDGGVGIATIKFSVQDSAKSLGRDNQGLDGCSYWEYTAVKKTVREFNKGETTDQPFSLADNLGPFSLGDWTFTLTAYNNSTDKKPMFTGNADATLSKGSTNRVSVVMKPSITSEGAGEIRIANPLYVDDAISVSANTIKIYESTSAEGAIVNETNTSLGSESVSFAVASGKHLVEVSYVADGTTYASGKIVVTVYDNLVTDITGTLSQGLASGSFDVSTSEDPNDVIYFDSAYGVSDGASDPSYTYTFSFGDIYGVDPTAKTTVTAVSKNPGMADISLEPTYKPDSRTIATMNLTTSASFDEITITTNIGEVSAETGVTFYCNGDRSYFDYSYRPDTGEVVFKLNKGGASAIKNSLEMSISYLGETDESAPEMVFHAAGEEPVSLYFNPKFDVNGALYEYSYKDVFGTDVPSDKFFSGWYQDEDCSTPATVGDTYNSGETFDRYARLEDLSVLTKTDGSGISSKTDIAVGSKYKIDGHAVMCVYKSDSPQFWGQFLFIESDSQNLFLGDNYEYGPSKDCPTFQKLGYGKSNTEKLKDISSQTHQVGKVLKDLCAAEETKETLRGWFIPSSSEADELLKNFTHCSSIFDLASKKFLTSTSVSGDKVFYIYEVSSRMTKNPTLTTYNKTAYVRLFRAL